MKKYEQMCNEHRKKFKKNWEFYTIAGDAWLAGFQAAREEALKITQQNNTSFTGKCINEMLSEQVEYNSEDGNHMIGESFAKRKE